MSPEASLQMFVESALQGLCEDATATRAEIVDSGGKNLFIILRCAKPDLPRVLGKQGKNIRALRDLTQAIAKRQGLFATLILQE